jgi:glycosyltransferase involved in cell wall biosynthesis
MMRRGEPLAPQQPSISGPGDVGNPILAIIPTFAGESRIAETLDHLAELEIPTGLRLEICVVDNFGGDGIAAIVHSWAERHSTILTRCIYQPLPGRMHALQLGIDSTSAEWIITVDDDVSLDRGWLVAAFSAMRDRGRVGFCGGPNELGGAGDLPPWMDPLLSFFAIYDFGPATLELVNRQLAGAGLLFRRRAWQQSIPGICRLVGRTKGSLVAGDDIESQRSIQRHGWIGLYVPAMRLIHRVDRNRFKRSIVARQTYSVGLEKCFHRMAGLSCAAAFVILPASILRDWPEGLIRLLTSRRGETWIFERNQIIGQMLSPFYFIWHRFKTGFKRVESSRSVTSPMSG